jgi:hypothetical protein
MAGTALGGLVIGCVDMYTNIYAMALISNTNTCGNKTRMKYGAQHAHLPN